MITFHYPVICSIVLTFLTGSINPLGGQSAGTTLSDRPFADLEEGSRITFVGNSLIEQAQQYGILEFMMLNSWPDKKLTFRNLGWSGDTAEGHARSYISTPPQPYELLIQQIKATDPDVVVVGYGNIEAFQGPEGLEPFEKNLERLIDTIQTMGALPVLLSPIPQVDIMGVTTNLDERNNTISLYVDKVNEIARERNLPYVDLFDKLMQPGQTFYKANGIHLNESGYFQAGKSLLNSLGHPAPQWKIHLNTKTNTFDHPENIELSEVNLNRDGLEFTLHEKRLPYPGHAPNHGNRILTITGLKKGAYTLFVDQENIVSDSDAGWEDGVAITQGHFFDKAHSIRKKLIQINDLYFQSYRPLNRTYLVGMRLHEQKQNAYELDLNKVFIKRLEDQINLLLEQEPYHYQLKRIE